MGDIETLASVMIPLVVKGAIEFGIILCLISATIAVYSYLGKKQSLKEIKTYLGYTFGIGILVSLSGLLVSFIANLDVNFDGFKRSIPVGYIVALVIYCLLLTLFNRD